MVEPAPTVSTLPFFYRRLHSVLGIIPIGAFLVSHLATNVLVATNTPEADNYQTQVNRIHALGPLLLPVEVLFIFLPLAFHAGLGLKIWLQGEPNTLLYPYWANVRYMLQRATGIVALLFILAHLWHMHWLGKALGGGFFDPQHASSTAAAAMQQNALWPVLYAIGITCACFHLANGTWTFLITWGITVGPQAQRTFGYACAVIGVGLTITGLVALNGFLR